MAPWLGTLLIMGASQLAAFAYFMGKISTKLERAAKAADDTQSLINMIRVAMATAETQSREVVLHVGDLEIRVRKLEAKSP